MTGLGDYIRRGAFLAGAAATAVVNGGCLMGWESNERGQMVPRWFPINWPEASQSAKEGLSQHLESVNPSVQTEWEEAYLKCKANYEAAKASDNYRAQAARAQADAQAGRK